VLPMTRPTKHPRTGTYLIRIAIPADLRDTTKRLYGVQRELRENLKTKDAAIARQRAPDALARLRAMLAQATRVASEAPSEPTAREVAALAGDWYRRRVGADHPDPDLQDFHLEIALELARDRPDWPDDEIAAYAPHAAEHLLRKYGFAATPESIKRLSAAIERTAHSFGEFLKRREGGDWSEDTNLAKFPRLPAKVTSSDPSAPSSGGTFDALLKGWALDHGFQIDARPIPRALYDRQRTLERLATFLGHRDADRLAKADVVRWKEDALGRGRTASTVRNDISEMSAVWAWGHSQRQAGQRRQPVSGNAAAEGEEEGTGAAGVHGC
jgi:hypothetical protein